MTGRDLRIVGLNIGRMWDLIRGDVGLNPGPMWDLIRSMWDLIRGWGLGLGSRVRAKSGLGPATAERRSSHKFPRAGDFFIPLSTLRVGNWKFYFYLHILTILFWRHSRGQQSTMSNVGLIGGQCGTYRGQCGTYFPMWDLVRKRTKSLIDAGLST